MNLLNSSIERDRLSYVRSERDPNLNDETARREFNI
jgi:hypothetical protein